MTKTKMGLLAMISTAQAANLANMTDRSIARLCAQGKIPGAVKLGSKWRINRDRFLEFLGIEETPSMEIADE